MGYTWGALQEPLPFFLRGLISILQKTTVSASIFLNIPPETLVFPRAKKLEFKRFEIGTMKPYNK
jgi:hypothetical protein